MEVIDNELKRYDNMQTDLENLKKSFDNLNPTDKEQCKSADGLETIMNEEKPKEVKSSIFALSTLGIEVFPLKLNFYSFFF